MSNHAHHAGRRRKRQRVRCTICDRPIIEPQDLELLPCDHGFPNPIHWWCW